MKAWAWLIIAIAGFGVMLWAYTSHKPIDEKSPWATGLIIMSSEAAAEKAPPADAIPARLRLLSSSDVAEILLFATGDEPPSKALGIKGVVRVKLIELPLAAAGIDAGLLQSGRMPEPGRNEILAGAGVEPLESRIVGGESLKVVGVLKPSAALFASSLLIPPDDANSKLFPVVVPSVLHAWLVRATPAQLMDPQARKTIEEAFPPGKFAWVTPPNRLEPRTFNLYSAGLAIFLLGGSGALIGLFRWLASKFVPEETPAVSSDSETPLDEPAPRKRRVPFLAGPLLEMKARPGLVWSVHLAYFGLVMAGSLLVYNLPEFQVILMGKVREALMTRNNPLGFAGEAYLSGNILRAALATFLVNFLLGSLAFITVPSMFIPGIGFLLSLVRAFMWGLLLAPAMQALALGMLPHSLTMLLEGEGYILAALFAAMLPIDLFRRSLGGHVLSRFVRGMLLNFKVQFWIALVLAVAAIYEATEVILMNR